MTIKKTWRVRGGLIGAAIGGLFHIAWHSDLTFPLLSNVLWEWGDLFAGIAHQELIGLHLGVLVVHVLVYTTLGTLIAILLRR
ncbi:MAG: hypothetical protein FVQ83_13785 [Chloroflexi bacterium]|nr:hypothetical protein [Chloroflexota bacterium]